MNTDHRPPARPDTGDGVERPATALIAHLRERLASGDEPVFVGIDGRSGVGKSTLAAAISEHFATTPGDARGTTVIEGDDFYAGGSDAAWDRRPAAEKADRVIDWRRQRQVLEALRRDGAAEWHRFDWDADDWDSDVVPLAPAATIARAAPVVVLEGAYSCRPELHDLLDLRVLLRLPDDVRRRRLIERAGDDHQADWDARWAAAEEHYFGTVMPPERFDIVLGWR